MKPKKTVSYFPVDSSEQALLLRVREADLAGRGADVVQMVDQLAEAGMTPADLEQAIQLFVDSQQGEGLEARFDNLEGRLKERVERGLAEIEGRLSKRLAGDASADPEGPPRTVPPAPPRPAAPAAREKVPSPPQEVAKDASLALRIGSELLQGTTASQFYVEVWRWLFDQGHVRLADLPIKGAGKKRYMVAAEPTHPTGKPFFAAKEAVPGAFVEANLSRSNILTRAKKLLDEHEVAFEVVVGTEG